MLNKDYRAKNADKSKVPAVWKDLVADARIEFHLLEDKNLAITRTKTDKPWFGMNNTVKSTAQGGRVPATPSERLEKNCRYRRLNKLI